MSWWLWVIPSVWCYLGAVAIRFDRASSHEDVGMVPAAAFLFWFFCIPLCWSCRRPREPWLPFEPLPNRKERVELARQRSLEMEREAELEFDGIFLK